MLYFIYIIILPLHRTATKPAEVDLSENRIVITNRGVYISKQNNTSNSNHKVNREANNTTNNTKQEGVNNSGNKEEGVNTSGSKEEGVNTSGNKEEGVNTSGNKEEGVNNSGSKDNLAYDKNESDNALCVIPDISCKKNKYVDNNDSKEGVMVCSVNKSTIEGVSEDIKECVRIKRASSSQDKDNEGNEEDKTMNKNKDTVFKSSSISRSSLATSIVVNLTINSSTNLALTSRSTINTNLSSIASNPLNDADSNDSDIEIITSCTTIYESISPNNRSLRNTVNIKSISPVISIDTITSSIKSVTAPSGYKSPSISVDNTSQSNLISKTSSSGLLYKTSESSLIGDKFSSSISKINTLQSSLITKKLSSAVKTKISESYNSKASSLAPKTESLRTSLTTHAINTSLTTYTSKPISSISSSTISSIIASKSTSNSINNNLLIKHANDFKSLKYGMDIQCIISQNLTFLKKKYDDTIPKIKNVLIYKTNDNKYKDYWNILIFTKSTDNMFIDETKYFYGILVSSYEDIPAQGKLSPLGLFQSNMPILDYIRDIQSIKLLILQIANTKGVSVTDVVNTKCNMSLIDKIVFKHMYKEMDGVKEDKCVFVCVCGDSFCKSPCVEVKCVDRNSIK